MKARTTSEVMLEQQLREIEEAFEEPECSEIAPAHIVTGPEDEVLEGEVVDEEKHENRSETSKSGSAHSTSRLPWLFPLTAENCLRWRDGNRIRQERCLVTSTKLN